MNLPPLPESFPAGYVAKTEYFYTAEQMQAYVQLYAQAAIDQAMAIVSNTRYHTRWDCINEIRDLTDKHKEATDWSAA